MMISTTKSAMAPTIINTEPSIIFCRASGGNSLRGILQFSHSNPPKAEPSRTPNNPPVALRQCYPFA
jgi:hypothetical protein